MSNPNPSIWSAHEEALNEYLADALGVAFDYPALTTNQGTVKGNASIQSADFKTGSTLRTSTIRVMVRIAICHTDPIEGHRLLSDWGFALGLAMESLYLDGLAGTYRGVAIANAFKAIKLTQPMEFQSEAYPQQATSTDSVFNGLVVARYEFPIEQVEDAAW